MKRYIFMILAVMTMSRCDQLDKLTQFDMDYDTSVTIPSTVGINTPFDIPTPAITTNADSEFSVNDTRKDMIEEITLKRLTLTVDVPSGGDFSFLNAIEIYISADGLDEQKIAWKENIPNDVGDVLELETSGVDLQESIKQESFDLRVSTTTDELITQDHEIGIHSVFAVDAKILGI